MAPSPDTHRDAVVMDATVGTQSSNTLDIDVPGAVVRLHPQPDGDQVHVHGFVPDCDPEEAHDAFDRQGIATHQGTDRLHIFSDSSLSDAEGWRWRRTHPVPIHLHVHLPRAMAVQAHLPGGHLHVSDLAGPVRVDAPGGSVEVTGVEGPLTTEGGGGTLTLTNCSCSTLNVQWVAGAVSLDQVEVESLDLQSVAASTSLQSLRGPATLSIHGASLTLQDVGGPCEARVHGGALTYRGAPASDLELTAIGGPLNTHLPPSTTATLVLSGAEVSLDESFAFEGDRSPRQIEGRLGTGGPALRFRAIRGPAQCHAE